MSEPGIDLQLMTDKPRIAFYALSKPIILGMIGLLAVAMAYLFRASANNLLPFPFVAVSFIVGIGCVGWLLRQQPLPYDMTLHIAPEMSVTSDQASARTNRILVGVGLFLILLVAEINGRTFQIGFLEQVHYLIQLALLLGGIGLVVIGLSRRDWRWPDMPRNELLPLIGIIILALVLRLVAVDSTIHRFVDELNFIDAITRLWDNPTVTILHPFSDVTAFTWLYPILQDISSGILGTGLVGLRAISAVFGTLTVVGVYFLAKTLFHDRLLALLAALLLATFPAHMHFSRIGLNNIADPLFGLLTLAFLIRGLQSQRRSDFVVAGAMLGLTQYFYEGGRLLFPGLVMVLMVIFWLKSGHKRQNLNGFAWMLLLTCIVAAPVYTTLAANRAILMPRLYNESIEPGWYFSLLTYVDEGSSAWLKQRFVDPLLIYFASPDSGWFYGGYESLVIAPLVPFFLLGAACLLWRIRSPGAILLLLWILLTSLGNSFLRESASVARYVVVFPALALLIAFGLRYALAVLYRGAKGKRWNVLAGALIVIILVVGQVFYYFHDHIPVLSQQLRQAEEWEDALFRLTTLPAETQAHFIMDKPVRDFNVNAFVRYWRLDVQVDVKAADKISEDYLNSLDPDADHVFFVNESKTEILMLLGKYFRLSPPTFSPYDDVLLARQLALYYADALE